MTTALDRLISAALEGRPRTALLLGGQDQEAAQALREALAEAGCKVRQLQADQLQQAERGTAQSDLAVSLYLMQDAPEHADAALAKLRDQLAKRVLVLEAPDSRNAEELMALGFSVLAREPLLLAAFDLYDYKQRPDWLNPKHWSNPDLWDQFRW